MAACRFAFLLFLSLGLASYSDAAGLKAPTAKKYESAVGKAVGFLTSSQADDGSWSGFAGSGVTSLATNALLRHGRTPSDPVVAKGLRFILGNAQPDGGIYVKGSNHRNYETCLAVMCLSAANQGGKYDKQLKAADKFLKKIQWDDGEGHDSASMSYGGAGYGRHERPDLSNTSFFIEALKELGNGPEDEAMQRALLFVGRCQNLETEHNTSPHAAKVNDGGFYYTVAAGGSSQAGTTANGGLRSYGSMSYAGLKSMIFAGVDKNDPRAKAAYAWIAKNYTLDKNPGIGDAGLYYYYHTFAKTLDAMDVEAVNGPSGKKHHWRADLVEQLAKRQRKDGAWTNKNERWLETDPNLVTAYCLMALSHAHGK